MVLSVFSFLPSLLRAIRVFMIVASICGGIEFICGVRFVSAGGRRLDNVWHVSELSRHLGWFRTQALQACDPGFKSRRPHQRQSFQLFSL